MTVEEPAPGHFVMSLNGELDLATAPAVDQSVAQLMATARVRELVVELAGVPFVDSSGIRALLLARRAAGQHGAAFAVRHPRGLVAWVLRVAGVDQLLGVVEPDSPPPDPGQG